MFEPVPTRAPEARDGFELLPVGGDLARPGELGAWRIRGDFFLARSAGDDVADVTDADVASWTAAWLRLHRPEPRAEAAS